MNLSGRRRLLLFARNINQKRVMKMIYITGDTHGEIDISRLCASNWPDAEKLTENDYLIICGDFGFPFLPTDFSPNIPMTENTRASRYNYEYWMKMLSECRFKILWVDGNHENHTFWYNQPVTMWHGGLVNIHPLAPNVIHLKRGEFYEIDGYTFWTMGGAKSHDRLNRIPEVSWWESEIPDIYEMNYGMSSLEKRDYRVDFIITHTLPADLQFPICKCYYSPEPTGAYLNEVYRRTDFRYWFCGHFHEDIDSNAYRIRVFYNDIEPIDNYLNR